MIIFFSWLKSSSNVRAFRKKNILARRGLEIEDFTCKNVSFFLNQRRNSIDEQDEITTMAKYSSPKNIISKTGIGGKKGGGRAGSLHAHHRSHHYLVLALLRLATRTPILLPRRPFILFVTSPIRAQISPFPRYPSHPVCWHKKHPSHPRHQQSKKMTKKSSSGSDTTELLLKLVWLGAIIYGIGFFLYYAYEIRLQAIKEFGPVIHEFDPYFNWRATQVRLCHDFLTAK